MINLKLTLKQRILLTKYSLVFVYSILILYSIITIMPFFWTVFSSFKTYDEIISKNFTFFPKHFTFSNYKYLFLTEPLFLKWIFNSIIISVTVTFINIFLNSMAGYALARLDFIGKKITFATIIGILAIPTQILTIPNFIVITKMGLINSYWALILPSAVNATYIFMMRQFFINFPRELEDAARIEGLSGIGVFFKIAFPLMKPAIATQAIFVFMSTWNDFIRPLMYLNNPDKFTITLGLSYFQTQYYTYWNYVMAASVISILPILILYIILNQYFISSLNIGGEK